MKAEDRKIEDEIEFDESPNEEVDEDASGSDFTEESDWNPEDTVDDESDE